MYYRNRTKSEILQHIEAKKAKQRARMEKIYSKRADIIKHKEFKLNHIKLDKFVTYYRGNIFVNKKSLNRLIKEAEAKWTPSVKPKSARG